jgi:hypothetical protein
MRRCLPCPFTTGRVWTPACSTTFSRTGRELSRSLNAGRLPRHGVLVAIIEIVSPGNKSSTNALRAFVRKAADLIWQGIHLLVVDLFPPSARDPQGIHKAIWDEIAAQPFTLPADKPLTVAAYRAAPTKTAYVEPIAVGDPLPAPPIFLTEDEYIPAPLEETYAASWAAFPGDFKELLEPAAP